MVALGSILELGVSLHRGGSAGPVAASAGPVYGQVGICRTAVGAELFRGDVGVDGKDMRPDITLPGCCITNRRLGDLWHVTVDAVHQLLHQRGCR